MFKALPIVFLVACTGRIGGEPAPPMRGLVDDKASSPAPTAPVAGDIVAAQPMRRLSHDEYDRTLRDLLGDTGAPAKNYVPDGQIEGLRNDAETLTASATLTRQHVETIEARAQAVALRRQDFVTCPKTASADDCARSFITGFGLRAWRRPLTQAEQQRLFAIYEAARQTNEAHGYALIVEALLVSPAFLFRIESESKGRRPTSYEMATRLSYALWGTLPDAALFAAAERNELESDAEIDKQVDRMLADPKAADGTNAFFSDWLDFDLIPAIRKDINQFPGFDTSTGGHLEREALAFVQEATWGKDRGIDALFTAPWSFTNNSLRKYYGQADTSASSGEELLRSTTDGAHHSGILTLGGLLSVLAKPDQTSPPLRGRFVRERLLCLTIPPPPPNVNNAAPPVAAGATTRERFTQHDRTECASCHRLMDPIGFGFEKYDARGVYRNKDNGRDIDDSGEVIGVSSIGAFVGAVALGTKLANSPEVRTCIARQLYRFVLGRTTNEDDEPHIAELGAQLSQDRQLVTVLRSITRSVNFRLRASASP